MRRVVIFGANSAIARACALEFLARGDAVHLISRHRQNLESTSTDLTLRAGHKPSVSTADLFETGKHKSLLEEASMVLGGIDLVLIAHGTLGDEALAQRSYPHAQHIFEVNLLSAVSLCTEVATLFESQGRGLLAVITSVAGDRGRPSNYVYGAAKGALSLYLSGLRARLNNLGAHVVTIKPGFVDTPMTAAFPKGLLWSSPERVAKGIVRAMDLKKDVVYLPWFWAPIMLIIRLIPERIFKRLKL